MGGLGISADAIAARVKGIDLLEISRLKFGLLPVFISRKAAPGSPHFGGPSLLFCLWRACQLLETLFAMSQE
jgi:hypothetical protein